MGKILDNPALRSVVISGAMLALVAVIAGSVVYFSRPRPPVPPPPPPPSIVLRPETPSVQAVREEIETQLDQCAALSAGSEQGSCFENASADILKENSFPTIVEALAALQTQPDFKDSSGACYAFLKEMGADLYAQTGDFTATFNQCPTSCGLSCYHGAALAHVESLARASGGTLSSAALAGVCDAFAVSEKHFFSICANSIGHAMFRVGGNHLDLALETCVSLGTMADPCRIGVFQDIVFSPAFAIGDPGLPEDAFDLCETVGAEHQEICYQTFSAHVGGRFIDDPASMARACESMPAAYQNYCYRMLGLSASANPFDAQAMVRRCDIAPDGESRGWCVSGLVRALVNRYGAHDMAYVAAAATQVCELAGEPFWKMCYVELGNNIGEILGSETHAELCGTIENEEGKQWCLWWKPNSEGNPYP